MKSFCAAFVFIAFIIGCKSVGAIGETSEDKEIISAVLTHVCEQSESGYSVLSKTSSLVDSRFIPKEVDTATALSLVKRNKTASSLPIKRVCNALKVVPQAEIEAEMGKSVVSTKTYRSSRWASFYSSYPEAKGVMYISMPGYSSDKLIAVVQVAVVCDELCGAGFYWIFRKNDGKWEFVKAVPGWNS